MNKKTKLRFIRASYLDLPDIIERLPDKIEIKTVIKVSAEIREVWFTVVDTSKIKSGDLS